MAIRFAKDFQTIKKNSSIKTELNLIEIDPVARIPTKTWKSSMLFSHNL